MSMSESRTEQTAAPAPDPFASGDEAGQMRLRVMLPEAILIEMQAVKIIAEAVDGSFALLPRHVDFVAPLVAGVVLVTDADGRETVIGTDEGTLVKCGQDVLVSTRRAMIGEDLPSIRAHVDAEFRTLDEHDATARTALAQLESGIIRRFIELEDKP